MIHHGHMKVLSHFAWGMFFERVTRGRGLQGLIYLGTSIILTWLGITWGHIMIHDVRLGFWSRFAWGCSF